MAYILGINEWNKVTKTNPKPIQNHTKTIPKQINE